MSSARGHGEQERTRVLVRIKPHDAEKRVLATSDNEPTVTLLREGKAPATFTFDGVLDQNADQSSVFSHCAEAVKSALLGINVAILAYGQTGSGKTYSMLGNGLENAPSSDDDTAGSTELDDRLGILPRALQCMFDEIQEKQLTDYSLHFSMMQVYNEKVYDLLQDRRREHPLQVREGADEGHTVYVQGLSEYRATSRDDVMVLLHRGMRNRAIRATDFNHMSSRSHMIFQARLQVVLSRGKEDDPSTHLPVVRRSVLTFVDLAGSEKWRPAQSNDATRELTNINTSLSALANCISAIVEPGRKHIPFRDSVLTRLLQHTLGGTARSLLLATVQSDAAFAEDTYSTLQFAARAGKMSATVAPNELLSDTHQLAKARREIQRLRRVVEELQSARAEATPRRGNTKKRPHNASATATAMNETSHTELNQQMGCAECKELQSEIGGLEQALADTEADLRAERAITQSLRQELEQLRQRLQQQPSEISTSNGDERPRNQSPLGRPKLSPLASPGFKYQAKTPLVQTTLSGSQTGTSPALSLPMLQTMGSIPECSRHGLKDCILCRMLKPAGQVAETPVISSAQTPGFARSPAPATRNECTLHGLQACMLCQLRDAKHVPSSSTRQITAALALDSPTLKLTDVAQNGIPRTLGDGKLPGATNWQYPSTEASLSYQASIATTTRSQGPVSVPEQSTSHSAPSFSADSILDYSDKLLAEIFQRGDTQHRSEVPLLERRHKQQKNGQRQRSHENTKPKRHPASGTKSPYSSNVMMQVRS